MKQHTSLELSKKLVDGGCKIKSKKRWHKYTYKDGVESYHFSNLPLSELKNTIYAYHFYDIIVTHAKEFFREFLVCAYCECETFDDDNRCEACERTDKKYSRANIVSATTEILLLLQQNKVQDAEDCFWLNCLYNPLNKNK